jgi:hypothetical protein
VRHVDKMSRVCGAEVLREWAAGATLNTDDRPFIEFSAAASHLGSIGKKTQAVSEAVDKLRAEQQQRWLGAGGR